jgi:hypothetical protein
MLCEACHQRNATVHLTTTFQAEGLLQPPGTQRKQHFCPECADSYFACTPGMNSQRDLICLSDYYRSKLYDLLEASHPEAFGDWDLENVRARYERVMAMQAFLRDQLKKERIELNEEAFQMLYGDFIGSHHFYARKDDYRRRKG